MKNDPDFQRLQEIAWRRDLTEKEKSELRAILETHPEADAKLKEEAALNAALDSTRDLTAPTNFTSRVMDAIRREENANSPEVNSVSKWWRSLFPRIAIAAAAAVIIATGYRQYVVNTQTQLADAARQLSEARALPDISVIQDFETIRNLDIATTTVDENLLAMSDDLLALNR